MRLADYLQIIFWVGFFVGATLLPWQQANAVELPEESGNAQVIFLGEQHENPGHHEMQERWVEELQPSALVFEMLTQDQAAAVQPEDRVDARQLAQVLEWEGSGWPDFALYYPIFAAAPDAIIFGAGVPSDRVRGLMAQDLIKVAGDLSERFSLDKPLPEGQQAQREALQMEAHCDALPEEMLPMMVSVQRLRDAALADAALTALSTTGGPVVVITGNGHAREDWGAPALLRLAAPDVDVFTLGQGEAGSLPGGTFSVVVDGPPVDRGDPCDAFRKG